MRLADFINSRIIELPHAHEILIRKKDAGSKI